MDILTYALAKSYTDKALLGVGTIKGAPCTVKSQTEDDEYVYVTLGWENNLGTSEETVVKIKKGADGAPGEPGPAGDPGPQGVSITKIEKIKTEGLIDTYQISFSDNTTFEYTISNGSTDYINITNKPSIEGVELTGNKTFKDLNIASADALTATDENLQNLSDLIGDKTSLPAPTDTVVNNIASVDAKVDAIIDDNETGLTKTFSSDKITKTFATLEEANKRIPQYDVLPTPTEAFGGKIVQFTGATTEDYIHNYFYECVQVEDNYKWVNVTVQNVPTKVSELTNDSNFVTETELNEKGYLTEHQDISGKVDKEEGKSLIADSEITRLSTVENYDDSVVKEDIATIKTDYATKTYVGEQIAAADHLKRETVTEVPTAETAAENVIYMLKVESAIGADKYKEYMLIDGEVACVGDTSVDLTDYAKKSEIPTELPANGGNSDTVNNHTVETDVPTDAKFTDTVYDDTEVKESIAELNSNLDGLGYGERCAYNILKPTLQTTTLNGLTCTQNLGADGKPDGTYTVNGTASKKTIFYIVDLNGIELNINNNAKFIGCPSGGSSSTYSLTLYDNKNNKWYDDYGNGKNISGTSKITMYIQIDSGVTVSNIIFKPMITFDTTATYDDYKPCIPSVKTLAEETNQQLTEMMDIKMLGWSVPKECPIQNYVDSDGVFHQRVGRLDLGTLDWTDNGDHKIWYTPPISNSKVNSTNGYCKGFEIVEYIALGVQSIVIHHISGNSYIKFKNEISDIKQATQGIYLYYELETPITITIDGNEKVVEIAEDVDSIKKETTINLFNPTLETITLNGVTCTDNGDGTYTLNGTSTSSSNTNFVIPFSSPFKGKCKLIGCPSDIDSIAELQCNYNGVWDSKNTDHGKGSILDSTNLLTDIAIVILPNVTVNNIVFKLMITTNLDATYDDFVPYTGDTGKLNSDVAAIKKDIGNLTGDIDAKTVNGHTVESNVPANAKFTDTVYDDTSIQNKLTTHTHDNRYYTETEVNNLLNGKANSSHSHGAYELPVGSIFLSSRKVAPSYGNWEYLGTIQSMFSDLPLIQAIGEGYVYNRTS